MRDTSTEFLRWSILITNTRLKTTNATMCKETIGKQRRLPGAYLLNRAEKLCHTTQERKAVFGRSSQEGKMGANGSDKNLTIILEDCSNILEQLEDWVEQLMDEGQWLQARILIDKTFEARYLVQKASDTENLDDAVYLHGILQRVRRQYDPMGSLVTQATQCYTMLRYLDTRVVACMKRPDGIEQLRNKLEEARFLVDRAVTKRDEGQIHYLLDVIRRLFVSYQTEFAPYKDCSERFLAALVTEIDEKIDMHNYNMKVMKP